MVDYNCMELIFFFGDTSCCQNKANPVSHGMPPPPSMDSLPPDKIPHGKSSPSMGFLHPPPSSAMGFLPGGGGGGLAIWYYPPPWGSSAMGFLPGKVCHMIFLHGERLPYGIIFAGTISHGVCSPIMKCVCVGGGEIYYRGETLPYGIVSPLGKFCHGISSG